MNGVMGSPTFYVIANVKDFQNLVHFGVSRDMILNRLWPSSVDIETRIVDVYIGYLRKKIDKDFEQKLIHSVRGFGYMIKEPAADNLE